jgi:cold shock CspA family protein
MAKARENYNKDEASKQRDKKKREKEQRKEERKAQSKSGASWEDMLAYVDENGNIVSTPPDPTKKKVINEEDIQIGIPKQENRPAVDHTRRGRVTFFNNSKGYGFIKDENGESIFVHINSTLEPIKESDRVTFEVEMGHKGPNAVRVKLIK